MYRPSCIDLHLVIFGADMSPIIDGLSLSDMDTPMIPCVVAVGRGGGGVSLDGYNK